MDNFSFNFWDAIFKYENQSDSEEFQYPSLNLRTQPFLVYEISPWGGDSFATRIRCYHLLGYEITCDLGKLSFHGKGSWDHDPNVENPLHGAWYMVHSSAEYWIYEQSVMKLLSLGTFKHNLNGNMRNCRSNSAVETIKWSFKALPSL